MNTKSAKNRISSVFSVIRKITAAIAVTALVSALLLNFSTLWSVRKINRGGLVKSGYAFAIINSGSMEPTVSVNDLLLIKGSSSYQTGDIITFVSPHGSLVTHRVTNVMEATSGGYITQGDANNIPDKEISSQRVLGRVIAVIPGAGKLVNGRLFPAAAVIFIIATAAAHMLGLIKKFARGENGSSGLAGETVKTGKKGEGAEIKNSIINTESNEINEKEDREERNGNRFEKWKISAKTQPKGRRAQP